MRKSAMLIGNKIKALRESKRLTQKALSKRTGIPKEYISRLENNHLPNPKWQTITSLAKGLEVREIELIGYGERPIDLDDISLDEKLRLVKALLQEIIDRTPYGREARALELLEGGGEDPALEQLLAMVQEIHAKGDDVDRVSLRSVIDSVFALVAARRRRPPPKKKRGGRKK